MQTTNMRGAAPLCPKFITGLARTLLLTIPAMPAYGQLFQNITIGDPKALGLANAVTADPPGIDSIHFNPAGLAKLKGRHTNYKFLSGHMTIESTTGSQAHSQKVRDAFEQINPGQNFPVDDQANRSASTSAPMVMLPFFGLTEPALLAAPYGGVSVELRDSGITLATMAYSPVAMGFKRDRDEDPGAYQGYEVGMTRLTYFAPTIGVAVNEAFSFGVGIGFSWQGFATKTKFRSPEQTLIFVDGAAAQLAQNGVDLSLFGAFENVGDLSLEMEDPFSLSFNLGLLYEPLPWLSLGLTYQSEAVADMKGDFVMTYSDAFLHTLQELNPLSGVITALGGAPFQAQKVQRGKVSMESILPAHIALGTSIKLTPAFKVNLDVKWTNNSSWDVLTIKYDQNLDFLSMASMINNISSGFGVKDNADPNELRLPRHYQDVLSYAVGMEYQWNDQLTLRAGYEPRGSAIPNDRVDFLVPMADTYLYTLGFAYRVDRDSQFGVGFGYLKSQFSAGIKPVYNDEGDVINVVGESKNANDTTPGQVVYNPYAYLPISGSTEAYLLAISYEVRH